MKNIFQAVETGLRVGKGSFLMTVYDLGRDLLTQLTRNPGTTFSGIWTPAGRQVVFTNETPSYDLYRVPIDGSTGPVAVVANTQDKYPGSVSPDGRELAYTESWAGHRRIRIVALDGPGPGRIVGDSTVWRENPRFSPDGSRLVYMRRGRKGPPGVSVYDLARRAEILISPYERKGYDGWPIFSADGRRVLFNSDLGGSDFLPP